VNTLAQALILKIQFTPDLMPRTYWEVKYWMKTVNSNSKRTSFFKHSSRRQINTSKTGGIVRSHAGAFGLRSLAKTINWTCPILF
jgi:hypothetical protein